MDVKETILACTSSPEKLRNLAPALFEAVIAELLASFGWEVSVTSATRDGGYDILGLTTDPSGLQTSWLVECKRYHAAHKVGIQTVRQLVGVKTHIGVPNAVLVTTSSFTADAQAWSSARQDLHLIGLDTLSKWIQMYSPLRESLHTVAQSFSSCFISYSSNDEDFAQKLAGRLKNAGVRVWFAPEDIRPGEKIYDQVKNAITSFDRLLIVLSVDSMKSNWVQTELASALAREKREGRRILFPVSLVPIEVIKSWECFDSDSGIDMAREVRAYYIPDFSNWKNSTEFEKQVAKVIQALDGNLLNQKSDTELLQLKQELRSSLPSHRAKAARELAKLGMAAAISVPTLRKALKDSSEQVRNAAASALASIGTAEAQKALDEFENR